MRTLWNRCKYCLSGLVLLCSVIHAPGFVSGAHWNTMGARVLEERAVGPFTVRLAEEDTGPAKTDQHGNRMKTYTVVLSPDGVRAVRAAYLRVGVPRGLQAAGTLLHGNPYRLHAHVPFPQTVAGEDTLWLTLETRDGSVHQVSWTMTEAMAAMSERRQTAEAVR